MMPAIFGRTTTALAIVVVLHSASLAQAQQKPPVAGDPARLAAVKEMMLVQGATAQFDTVIDTMTRGMAGMLRKQHPARAKEIEDVFSRMAARFNARKSEVIDMIAPLFAERFTIEEIQAITAFYHSPVGAKLVREQPAITQQSMVMGMAWGQRIGQEIEREAREELRKRGLPL
jgi:hypothetical protein